MRSMKVTENLLDEKRRVGKNFMVGEMHLKVAVSLLVSKLYRFSLGSKGDKLELLVALRVGR